MSKPLPIIHLTRRLDHERLVCGLHALGYQWRNSNTLAEDLPDYLNDVSDMPGNIIYPWVALHDHGEITAYVARKSISMGPTRGYTTVNSVSHFLAYTRSLGAPQVPDYEYDGDDFAEVDLDGN